MNSVYGVCYINVAMAEVNKVSKRLFGEAADDTLYYIFKGFWRRYFSRGVGTKLGMMNDVEFSLHSS